MTTGFPASRRRMLAGASLRITSTLPPARAPAPPTVVTYSRPVNPSARSSSSATHWGGEASHIDGKPGQAELGRLGRRLRPMSSLGPHTEQTCGARERELIHELPTSAVHDFAPIQSPHPPGPAPPAGW